VAEINGRVRAPLPDPSANPATFYVAPGQNMMQAAAAAGANMVRYGAIANNRDVSGGNTVTLTTMEDFIRSAITPAAARLNLSNAP